VQRGRPLSYPSDLSKEYVTMRGIFNLLLGGLFVYGGLSGKAVLIGTDSGVALAGVGVVFCGLGLYRLAKSDEA
jgi:hypothetical protein